MNEERRITLGAVLLALLKAGCYLLLFLGCQTVVTLLVTTAFTVVAVVTGAGDPFAVMEQVLACTGQISLISNLLTLLILLVFFLVRRKKPLGEAGLVPARPRMVAAAAAITPALYVFVMLVLSFLPEAWMESYAEASSALNDTSVWTLLATVFAAPLAEEVVFRGLIQSRLRRVMPGWLSVMIAAALFGLCHGQAVWMAYAFALGLFFGWMDLRAGSILPSLAAHFVFNAIGHFSMFWTGNDLLLLVILVAVSVVGCLALHQGVADYFRRPVQPEVP